MGRRQPEPKARLVAFNPTGACLRLCSLRSSLVRMARAVSCVSPEELFGRWKAVADAYRSLGLCKLVFMILACIPCFCRSRP